MTTSTLQKTGFGVMAYTHSIATGAGYTATQGGANPIAPNFMYNQLVGYEASNWIYNPLKYWPNETAKGGTAADKLNVDQQSVPATSDDKEGVSFFAYAPYVKNLTTKVDFLATTDGFNFETTGSSVGLKQITNNEKTGDPKISYQVADGTGSSTTNNNQPSKSVDLLWGTSSGFTYHPVSTNTAKIMTAGEPVKDMEKPALDEKIKFDFKHALARIGMTVVGAFDQTAAGGTKAPSTRVTIESITVNGKDFGINGVLNLNNTTANLALWEEVKNGAATPVALDGSTVTSNIIIDNGAKSEMNTALKYNDAVNFPTNAGVLSTEQNVISAGARYTTVTGTPVYSPTTVYYTAPDVVAVATYGTSTYEANGTGYKKLTAATSVTKTVAYTISDPTTATTITHDANAVKPETYDDSSTKLSNGDVLYTKSTNDYVFAGIVGTNDRVLFGSGTAAATYYKLTVAEATPTYAGETTYYTRTDAPGYFMVIPYNRSTALNDATVKVTITYYVTTYDANLKSSGDGGDDKVSQIKNIISQDVVLKDFGNGKAYNLKLILGLTSVKVEAEATDWEVGAVESNLPMNLE